MASDYVLVAFQTQSDSLDGANDYISRFLRKLVEEFNAPLDVIGILPNQLHSAVKSMLQYFKMQKTFLEKIIYLET